MKLILCAALMTMTLPLQVRADQVAEIFPPKYLAAEITNAFALRDHNHNCLVCFNKNEQVVYAYTEAKAISDVSTDTESFLDKVKAFFGTIGSRINDGVFLVKLGVLIAAWKLFTLFG